MQKKRGENTGMVRVISQPYFESFRFYVIGGIMMDNKANRHFRLRLSDEEYTIFEQLVSQYHEVLKLKVSKHAVAKQAFERGCQAIIDEVIRPAITNEVYVS